MSQLYILVANSQRKKDKKATNYRQNTTHKNKDWATRNPLQAGVDSGTPKG